MPKRKPSSPIEAVMEKLVESHHGDWLAALNEAQEAVWSHTPQAERVFERAAGMLDDDDEVFLRQVAALIQQRVDARSGKNRRTAAKNLRRGKYKKSPDNPSGETSNDIAGEDKRIRRAELRAEVLALHARRPDLTLPDVCRRIATSRKFGYKSAWAATQACKLPPAITWSTPAGWR